MTWSGKAAPGIVGTASAAEKQVVMVSYWGCFLRDDTGAHARVRNLVDFLFPRTPKLIFYSIRQGDGAGGGWTDDKIAEFARLYPGAELVLENASKAQKLLTKARHALLTAMPGSAAPILSFAMPGVSPKLQDLKARYPRMLCVVNYYAGLGALNGVDVSRTVVECHDVQFVKWRKIHGGAATDKAVMSRLKREVAALNSVAGIIAITQREGNLLEDLLSGPHVFRIPQYGSEIIPVSEKTEPASHDLMFAASDNSFNVSGFESFVETGGEWLGKYSIAVCGKICSVPEIRDLADRHPNISLLGFVPDIAALYASSKASLSPVDGTGLKIKVVESLRHGTPVFASEHSMSGLNAGYEGCVFPLDRAAIEALLADPVALKKSGEAARSYIGRMSSENPDVQALLEFLGLEQGDALQPAEHFSAGRDVAYAVQM